MFSGTKNQEIDITAIENQNENIQPIKSGRSALKLSSLFLSKISQSCSSSSITDSSKNNNIRIKDDDYETKLENLLRVETFNPISLLDRHRKVHLEFQRKIIILELIENDQSIKSKAGPIITKETKDQSLIGKLWKNPLEVYVHLFYEEFGNVCLELKDFRRFREVLKLGIEQDGRGEAFCLISSKEKLTKMLESTGMLRGGELDWCLRLLIDLIVLNLDQAQELYASDNDSTKTGEDEVCCGQTSTAEHSKQSNCTRINKGTSSNNWLKSNKFKVFEDGKDDHQIEIPGLMTKWDDLQTVKSNQRQNLIEPTTWKDQKLLVDD
ncbi:hypothetical protein PPACK8108_LOCUS5233 [Phakopsora pachyrhizi]|uniref:Uncharacterized protein n=1 Tax=Phakopsora pachyrhizi TaxID=170000 RepID=A0AAV0AR94_PHAPC|nr:hypothetical protein PPACK8108_LOCUS5233 [Phakopsora pachyrhizi]